MHGSLLAGRRQRGSRLPGVIRRAAAWMVAFASVGSHIPVEAVGFAPSETVFPATTRIWVSAPDPRRLRENFDNTDYGQLLQDPQMRPFVESVRDQARKAGRQRLGKLGLSFEDLASVPGGEVALGVIEPAAGRLATLILVDTTGHDDEASRLVETIGARLVERKAEKTTSTSGGTTTMTVYEVPQEPGTAHATRVAIVLHPGALIIGDDPAVVMQTASSLSGRTDGLATVASYRAVSDRCADKVSSASAPIRWFVDPLGFARAVQAANPPREKRKGPDYVAILGRQGFDAVKAVGGVIVLDDGLHDLRHHTLVHAPPLEGRKAFAADRYKLAARMLQFPNTARLEPPSWVPRDVSSWVTMQWDMKTAFESAESLVDDVVGEKGVFDDVIASLKEDPDGPQIDVANELVGCLGTRVSIISDHTMPIDVDSERLVIAIETHDPDQVAKTVAKSMSTDPDMRKVEFNGHIIWELIDRTDAIPMLEIETPGLISAHADSEADSEAPGRRGRLRDREEKLLPHSAVTIAHGHLLVASHRDFLERVLATSGDGGTLADTGDFGVVTEELARLFPGETALRSFGRGDETIRPAYEMLRRGEMPKSKSLMGQLLNVALGDGKEGSVREQRIDGSTLPEFDVIQRYLGAAGVGMETVPEGWYIAGVALPRDGRSDAVAREPSDTIGR